MHPHGVKYNPEYDGAYMGELHARGRLHRARRGVHLPVGVHARTRVGAWPYHDHGPNHTLNTFRGLFGTIVVRPRGAKWPDVVHTLFAAPAAAAGHRPGRATSTASTAAPYAGNTPTLTRARRPGRRDPRLRHGLQLPHLPHPRPPLDGSSGGVRRQPGVRAQRDRHGPLRRGQPGSLALPLPRLLASGRGDGGLVRGQYPQSRRRGQCASLARGRSSRWRGAGAPAAAGAQTYPEPKEPGTVAAQAEGPAQDLHGLQDSGCDFTTIQKAVNKAKRRRHGPRASNGIYREAVKINGPKKRYLRLIGNPKHPRRSCSRAAGNMQNGDLRQRRRRGHRRRLHGARLQVQRLLLHEPRRLHDEPPDRRAHRRLRPLRVQHHRRPDAQLRGLLRQRRRASTSGRRRRRTSRSARSSRNVDGWGSPLGFSAHQHALRDDHQEPLLQQRARHRAERAGLREVPAAGGQRDHRQRHLLEQLQLPRRASRRSRSARTAPRRSSPVGTGILLLGGRGNRVENNRIYGNYLAGVAGDRGHPAPEEPRGARASSATSSRDNQFGLNGTDTNGRDIIYDGNGTDNCFSDTPA